MIWIIKLWVWQQPIQLYSQPRRGKKLEQKSQSGSFQRPSVKDVDPFIAHSSIAWQFVVRTGRHQMDFDPLPSLDKPLQNPTGVGTL